MYACEMLESLAFAAACLLGAIQWAAQLTVDTIEVLVLRLDSALTKTTPTLNEKYVTDGALVGLLIIGLGSLVGLVWLLSKP
jgi:hypothetical protein